MGRSRWQTFKSKIKIKSLFFYSLFLINNQSGSYNLTMITHTMINPQFGNSVDRCPEMLI
ncbi:MAG: hypothetical protein YK1312THETA_1580002 [Marine Group I thaumarchaeote]|nr:MAG: hypothetical protein YK1312THETA_1580002 [Marine Group I thaumarchaeote]